MKKFLVRDMHNEDSFRVCIVNIEMKLLGETYNTNYNRHMLILDDTMVLDTYMSTGTVCTVCTYCIHICECIFPSI